YKDVIETVPGVYDQIKKIAAQQLATMQSMKLLDDKPSGDKQQPEVISLAAATVRELPELLTKSQDAIDKRLKQKVPDYKAAASSAEQNLEIFSKVAEQVLAEFSKSKDDKQLPDAMRKYMA